MFKKNTTFNWHRYTIKHQSNAKFIHDMGENVHLISWESPKGIRNFSSSSCFLPIKLFQGFIMLQQMLCRKSCTLGYFYYSLGANCPFLNTFSNNPFFFYSFIINVSKQTKIFKNRIRIFIDWCMTPLDSAWKKK